MRLLLLCLTLLSSAALAGANCANSQSWQCQHHSAATGSSNPQQPTPDHQTSNPPTQTTNQPLGGLIPDIHGVALTPVAVPNQVPTPIPQPKPVVTPNMVPQPMNIPGQVPTPIPQRTPIAVPNMVPQPMNIPGQVPTLTPQPNPLATPHMASSIAQGGRPALLIKPGNTGSKTPPTQPNHLVSHHLNLVQPLAKVPHSATGNAQAQYGLEMIEPGVQNHRVEVYRSHDALEQIHKDVIPMDEGDFNLTVIGTRRPDYMHDQP